MAGGDLRLVLPPYVLWQRVGSREARGLRLCLTVLQLSGAMNSGFLTFHRCVSQLFVTVTKPLTRANYEEMGFI